VYEKREDGKETQPIIKKPKPNMKEHKLTKSSETK
jgi:hypothetical protein